MEKVIGGQEKRRNMFCTFEPHQRYIHMYVWAPTEARKGARSPSELESQAVLTSLVWALGTKHIFRMVGKCS